MDSFTIRDIENLSGIKAHTLRIWEKRYKLFQPKRKKSNHRFYDNEDLKFFIKIAFLCKSGYKISSIAALSEKDINAIASKAKNTDELQQLYISGLINTAIDFNENEFEDILHKSIVHFGLEDCIIKVVYPFFEKIGLLWITNNAKPSQEHFSSNIIRNKLILAIDQLEMHTRKNGSPVILFTPEGEHHEIPLLFAAYLFKKNKKKVIYAGANVSIENLAELCSALPSADLFFHLITNLTKGNIDQYLSALRSQFPGRKITMSGPLTKQATTHFRDCHLICSLDELLGYIKSFGSQHS